MPNLTKNFIALGLATALLAGCVSQLPEGRPAYVYVADNGIVTFHGEKLKASELSERLKKAGAKPSTHIMLVAQGDVPNAFLSNLAVECSHAGLPNCTIKGKKEVVVLKGEVQ